MQPKKKTSQPISKPPAVGTQPAASVSQVRRKSNLKAKAQAANNNKEPSSSRTNGETVLGGVDYVTLMMGGRRKAREEVKKMAND
jgi:hypothetical protein